MFGRETRMLLRHYLEHGTSKSALARQLGVSRDTIHRWIRDGDLDRDLDDTPVRYGPRRPIADQAGSLSRPSSRPASPPIPRSRPCGCSRRSAPPGYTGGYSQLKAFVRQLRPVAGAGAGGALRDAGRAPGAGGLRGVPASRGASATRCWWCSATRGCCGVASVRARTCARCSRGLEDAFLAFGGVPQELLFDQMKAVITRDLRLAGRGAGAQSRVPPLRAPLGLHAARVPAVSRPDQGQGRAPGALRAREFRLRPHVPQ